MNLRTLLLMTTCSLATAAGPSAVRAETRDAPAAEALFRQARALMEQGQFAQACPKFAESNRLDKGVGTLLNLAYCQTKEGKTASAWGTYLEAAALARSNHEEARAAGAEAKAAALESKLSHLIIRPSEAPPDRVLIRKDNLELGQASLNVRLPVDPGPHQISATYEDRVLWTAHVVVRNGANETVIVPPLRVPVAASADNASPPALNSDAPVGSAPANGAGAPADSSVTHGEHGSKPQKTVALVLGGVGLAAVGLGSYFGLHAGSLKDGALQSCPNPTHCAHPDAVSDGQDAHQMATLSTIAFVSGGALLATGLVLYLLPSSDPSAPSMSLRVQPANGGSSLSFRGAW